MEEGVALFVLRTNRKNWTEKQFLAMLFGHRVHPRWLRTCSAVSPGTISSRNELVICTHQDPVKTVRQLGF